MQLKGTIKKCKNCDILFISNKKKHTFCNRKCFKEYEKKEAATFFPQYICQNLMCRYEIQLDFFPLQEPQKLMTMPCIKCGKKNNEN